MVEIPEGAIPVSTIDYSKSHTVSLNPYSTIKIKNSFYFPYAGKFKLHPANVSKEGKVLAIAPE